MTSMPGVLGGAPPLDRVPEEDARFGELGGAGDELVPELTGLDHGADVVAVRLVGELQDPVRVVLDGLHEGVGDADAEVCDT